MTAEYFDGWYADMAASSAKDRLWDRLLGLPEGTRSTSLLTAEALEEVERALALQPGEVLLDLACGRGGYGRAVAGRAGAALVGVDFSAVAVREAQAAAPSARYAVGALEATGLDAGSVDALLCVDALQFAQPLGAALAEALRVLRPGGRLVATTWQAQEPDDPDLPERLRRLDLARGLLEAGFTRVEVQDRPTWLAREREVWQQAVAVDPAGDPALQSLVDEGTRSLASTFRVRRVLATARASAADG